MDTQSDTVAAHSADHEFVETRFGPMLCFRRDTGVSQRLRDHGEFAVAEIGFYRSLLKARDVFIDVGANIGAISRALHHDVPNLRVLAFEPQPAFHAVAVHNLLGLPDCSVLPYAVGGETKLITIPEPDIRQTGNYGALSLDAQSGRTLPAPIIRLDTFLLQRGLKPRLIKIDVQGMEDVVLQGCEDWVKPGTVLSVEADDARAVKGWLTRLLDKDFACYLMRFPVIPADRRAKDEPRLVSRHIIATRPGTDEPELTAREALRIPDLATCLAWMAKDKAKSAE
jgi:FkbM family methyltransferase